jgi:hypothetical protein
MMAVSILAAFFELILRYTTPEGTSVVEHEHAVATVG